MRRWVVALLAAALFHLWDGRTLDVGEFIRHGDEYVVTLRDGRTLILRQAEVREIAPARDEPAGRPPADAGRRDRSR